MSTKKNVYQYKPLPDSAASNAPDGPGGSIRLLSFRGTSKGLPTTDIIEVDLQAYTLSEGLRFDALSYEWGKGDFGSIKIDGKTLSIPRSLHLFLKALRFSPDAESTLYFADAVCIDQQNLQERASQVQLMGQVYSLAQRVHIWLGPEFAGIGKLFKFCNALKGSETDSRVRDQFEDVFGKHDEAAFQEAVQAFTTCTYWQRLWIIQEILLAKRLLVHCGKYTIAWDALYEGCQRVLLGEVWKSQSDPSSSFGGADTIAQEVPDDFDHSRYVSLYLQTTTARSAVPTAARRYHGVSTRSNRLYTLKEAIMLHGLASCTDQRDRVYGLLGLVLRGNDRGYFSADYGEDLGSLFQRVMHHCHPDLRTDAIQFCSHLEKVLGLTFDFDRATPTTIPASIAEVPLHFSQSLTYSIVVRFAGRLQGQINTVPTDAAESTAVPENNGACLRTWTTTEVKRRMSTNAGFERGVSRVCWSMTADAKKEDLVYSIDDSCCGLVFRQPVDLEAQSGKRKRKAASFPIFVGQAVAHVADIDQKTIRSDIQSFLEGKHRFATKLIAERPLLQRQGAPFESQVSLTELRALTCKMEGTVTGSSSSILRQDRTVRPLQPEPPAQKVARAPVKKRRFDFQWTSGAGESQ